jgi:hypothetical protein
LYEEGSSQKTLATFTITVAKGKEIPKDKKIGMAIAEEPPPDMALKNAAPAETTKMTIESMQKV